MFTASTEIIRNYSRTCKNNPLQTNGILEQRSSSMGINWLCWMAETNVNWLIMKRFLQNTSCSENMLSNSGSLNYFVNILKTWSRMNMASEPSILHMVFKKIIVIAKSSTALCILRVSIMTNKVASVKHWYSDILL